MAEIPDELWTKILELGLQYHHNCLTYKDLSSLSISSRRLNRLSNDPSLWLSLLSLDFSSRFSTHNNKDSNPSPKTLYRTWYEKDKAKRLVAHMRAVMRLESRIAEHSRRLDELRRNRVQEQEKINSVAAELNNLHKIRQASIALNVWQPEVIRGRQKQIVEQCSVPVDARINALHMELKLCKQQILGYENAYRNENQRFEDAKKLLASMKYRPLQDSLVSQWALGDHSNKKKRKRSNDGNRTVILLPLVVILYYAFMSVLYWLYYIPCFLGLTALCLCSVVVHHLIL